MTRWAQFCPNMCLHLVGRWRLVQVPLSTTLSCKIWSHRRLLPISFCVRLLVHFWKLAVVADLLCLWWVFSNLMSILIGLELLYSGESEAFSVAASSSKLIRHPGDRCEVTKLSADRCLNLSSVKTSACLSSFKFDIILGIRLSART